MVDGVFVGKLGKEESVDSAWKDDAASKAAEIEKLKAEGRNFEQQIDQLRSEVRGKLSKEALAKVFERVEKDKHVKYLNFRIYDLEGIIVKLNTEVNRLSRELELQKAVVEEFRTEEEHNVRLLEVKKLVRFAEAEDRKLGKELARKKAELVGVNDNLLTLKLLCNKQLDELNALRLEKKVFKRGLRKKVMSGKYGESGKASRFLGGVKAFLTTPVWLLRRKK